MFYISESGAYRMMLKLKRHLQAQLRAAGMNIENLIKITTIVRNQADISRCPHRPCRRAWLVQSQQAL
jgi:hypothetical protein